MYAAVWSSLSFQGVCPCSYDAHHLSDLSFPRPHAFDDTVVHRCPPNWAFPSLIDPPFHPALSFPGFPAHTCVRSPSRPQFLVFDNSTACNALRSAVKSLSHPLKRAAIIETDFQLSSTPPQTDRQTDGQHPRPHQYWKAPRTYPTPLTALHHCALSAACRIAADSQSATEDSVATIDFVQPTKHFNSRLVLPRTISHYGSESQSTTVLLPYKPNRPATHGSDFSLRRWFVPERTNWPQQVNLTATAKHPGLGLGTVKLRCNTSALSFSCLVSFFLSCSLSPIDERVPSSILYTVVFIQSFCWTRRLSVGIGQRQHPLPLTLRRLPPSPPSLRALTPCKSNHSCITGIGLTRSVPIACQGPDLLG